MVFFQWKSTSSSKVLNLMIFFWNRILNRNSFSTFISTGRTLFLFMNFLAISAGETPISQFSWANVQPLAPFILLICALQTNVKTLQIESQSSSDTKFTSRGFSICDFNEKSFTPGVKSSYYIISGAFRAAWRKFPTELLLWLDLLESLHFAMCVFFPSLVSSISLSLYIYNN